MFETEFRFSEFCELTKEDIKFDKEIIKITHQLQSALSVVYADIHFAVIWRNLV